MMKNLVTLTLADCLVSNSFAGLEAKLGGFGEELAWGRQLTPDYDIGNVSRSFYW